MASVKTGRSTCEAKTASGKTCRNAARANSKYCASHKGYRPGARPAAASTAAARKGAKTTTASAGAGKRTATRPKATKASAGRASTGKASAGKASAGKSSAGKASTGKASTGKSPRKASVEKQPQCAALKADGGRCRNASTARSKYCSSHKGYRPSGVGRKRTENLQKARQMKEVRQRARRTPGGRGPVRNRPAALRVMGSKATCAARTQSGKPCGNAPRSGSKYCASHRGYRPKRS